MRSIRFYIVFTLLLFSANCHGWSLYEEDVIFEEDLLEATSEEIQLKDVTDGTHFETRYKDITPFDALTIDTRFNTPISIKIEINPRLNANELIVLDKKGNSNIFDIVQRGHELIISPRRIQDYPIKIELYCNSLKTISSFGNNKIQISGLINHVFMLVLNDTSYAKITNSIIRKLYIQANDSSQVNSLDVDNQYASIFAFDRSLVWINADYAEIKVTEGAFVKCERFPYDHRLRTQKNSTFLKEIFDHFDEKYM